MSLWRGAVGTVLTGDFQEAEHKECGLVSSRADSSPPADSVRCEQAEPAAATVSWIPHTHVALLL